MSSFEKSPPELVARFEATAAGRPEVTARQMFGYPALFVGGNLVTSLFADRWVVRLAPDALATLLATPGAGPFSPMPGRTMRGYGLLPVDVVADDAALDGWITQAISFGRTLPPK